MTYEINKIFHFDHSKNIKTLFLLRAFQDLILRGTFFFFPVFLFETGKKFYLFEFFKMTELQKGLMFLPIFYLGFRLIQIFIQMPLAKLMAFLGYKNSMIVGQVFHIFMILSVWMMIKDPGFIFFATFFYSLYVIFFWPIAHTLLSKQTMKIHVGQDLGVMQFLLQLLHAMFPAVAGILIYQFGFSVVFALAAVLQFLAIFVTLRLETGVVRDIPNWQEFLTWFKRDKSYRSFSISVFGRQIGDIMLVIWPLYVLFILGSVEKVGYIYSLALFLALILSIFIGVYIDHHKSKKPFVISGTLLSIIWFFRSQATSVINVALSDLLDKLVGNFHWLYFDSLLIKKAKGLQAFSHYYYRELIVAFGSMAFWTAFIIVFTYFDQWWFLFVLAAVGAFLTTWIQDEG